MAVADPPEDRIVTTERAEFEPSLGTIDRRLVRLLAVALVLIWFPFAEAAGRGRHFTAGQFGLLIVYMAGIALFEVLPKRISHPTAAATLAMVAGALLAMDARIGWAVALLLLAVIEVGTQLETRRISLVIGATVVAIVVAGIADGRTPGAIVGYAAATVGVAFIGQDRRRGWARALTGERLAHEATRTQQEQSRASALAERARIARDVHDLLGHSLSAIAVQVETARTLLAREASREALAESLLAIRDIVRAGLVESRQTLAALRGDTGELGSLLVGLGRQSCDPAIDVEIDIGDEALAPQTATVLYRISQEALSNARRHGLDGTTRLRVQAIDGQVRLTVRNPAAQPGHEPRRGYGVTGMRERVDELGGTLEAGYEADRGEWVVRAELPITSFLTPQP